MDCKTKEKEKEKEEDIEDLEVFWAKYSIFWDQMEENEKKEMKKKFQILRG